MVQAEGWASALVSPVPSSRCTAGPWGNSVEQRKARWFSWDPGQRISWLGTVVFKREIGFFLLIVVSKYFIENLEDKGKYREGRKKSSLVLQPRDRS